MPELFAPDAILAISLWQPWASLWLTNAKPHETRDWPFPEKYLGEECLVHAAKRPIERDLDPALEMICQQHFGLNYRAQMRRGAFVGKVVLASRRQMLGNPRGAEPVHADDETCGHWAPGRFAWRRGEDRLTFANPVPAIGRQGFWRVPRSLIAELADV